MSSHTKSSAKLGRKLCNKCAETKHKSMRKRLENHVVKTMQKLSENYQKAGRKLCENCANAIAKNTQTMRQLCETMHEIYATTVRKPCEHYADTIKNIQKKGRRHHLLTGIIKICVFPLAAEFKQTELKLCPSHLLFRMPSVAAENSNSSMSLYQTANSQNSKMNLCHVCWG